MATRGPYVAPRLLASQTTLPVATGTIVSKAAQLYRHGRGRWMTWTGRLLDGTRWPLRCTIDAAVRCILCDSFNRDTRS